MLHNRDDRTNIMTSLLFVIIDNYGLKAISARVLRNFIILCNVDFTTIFTDTDAIAARQEFISQYC